MKCKKTESWKEFRSLVALALTFGLFLLKFTHSYAQRDLKTIVLNDKLNADSTYILGSEKLAIFEDHSGVHHGLDGNLTIDSILSPKYQKKFKVFRTEKKNVPASNWSKGEVTFWVKFKVRNDANFERSFIFESYSPHTQILELYIPDKHGTYFKKQSGQKLNFYKREYINKNLVLDLPIEHGETKIFYARIFEPKYYSSFDFRIKTSNYFSEYSTIEYYLLGMFYGLMIIMAIYNLLLFLSLKERVYLFYVFYVVAGMLSTLSDDGLGYQFIWFNVSGLNLFIGQYIAPLFLLFSFVYYTRTFLHFDQQFPKLDRMVIQGVAIIVIYELLRYTVLPEALQTRWLYVIPYLFIPYMAIKSFMKGYRPARFFIAGSIWIAFSMIINQLRANGTIEGTIFTVYSLNYGLVLDVLLFSFALSERIKFIKVREEEAQQKIIEQLRENEKLSDKVNRELEAKVTERTKELNEANEALLDTNARLQEMTEKANEMSAKLDLDNWQLQKTNKESIKARIRDEEVTYDEFLRIFSDDNACYKYLAEIKWANGFKCKKCNHTKFMDGNKPYSRKCTRCAYPESATAFTLFHGLRFPIVKAFYLTYLTHRGDNRKTLRELSEMLDLRRNTCWNFKKKVQETIDNNTKNGKANPETWEEIIFLY